MSQRKSREQRQKVRSEFGALDKTEKTTYKTIKHRIEEVLKPGESPRFFTTNVCTGLRGAYLKAKKRVRDVRPTNSG